MRKAFFLIALLLGLSGTAQAQQFGGGNLSATGDVVSCIVPSNTRSVAIQVTGTWTGTLTFTGSLDGVTFTTVTATNQAAFATGTTTTANGIFGLPALVVLRVTATSITANGPAVVNCAQAGAGGGGGGGGGGSVTQGTSPWIVAPATGTFATDQTFGTSTYTEATTTGPLVGMVRTDTPAALANTTNEVSPLAGSALSGLYVASASDPCLSIAVTTLPVSVAADTAVITATASKRTYICGGALIAAAAEVVSIWEGTGSACGTSSAALVGSTTEANGMSLAANGGFTVPSSIRGISTNVDVCIRLNATNRVAGWLTYVQAP